MTLKTGPVFVENNHISVQLELLLKGIGRRLASSNPEVQLCLTTESPRFSKIAACAEEILDDWGEAKRMDFSASVPAEEVEAIVAFLRAIPLHP